MIGMESFKRKPEEFGGIQDWRMSAEELLLRYCCARGCGSPGYVQMALPRLAGRDGLFRALCRKHFVQMVYVQSAFLGDPSPEGEAREIAETIGMPFDPLRDLDAASVFSPRFARCLDCGGGFVAETQGMYAGQRYIHTCGVTNREARDQ